MKRLTILIAFAVILMATPVMAMPWPTWKFAQTIFWYWGLWGWLW